jgi:hypothetical protein
MPDEFGRIQYETVCDDMPIEDVLLRIVQGLGEIRVQLVHPPEWDTPRPNEPKRSP